MGEILTKDEEIFALRALPHFMAGKSAEDALRAVLDDDARILQFMSRPESEQFLGWNDAPWSHQRPEITGLRQAITAEVYQRLRTTETGEAV